VSLDLYSKEVLGIRIALEFVVSGRIHWPPVREHYVHAAKALLLLAVVTLLGSGCASAPRAQRTVDASVTQSGPTVGIASYYGKQYHGRKTASGERFNMHELTAAHRTLPFGTNLKVTNLANDRSVVVRVNDRGPFKRDRILDVSLEAARRLQMVAAGVTRVRIEPLHQSDSRRTDATAR
jgi:rare lipoprotein A